MVLTDKQLINFWSKVKKTDGCWDWTCYTAYGYGKLNILGNVYFAHRISLFIAGCAIEPSKKEKGCIGKIVMHTCDNRRCVNPNHLKIRTQKDNMADAKYKGRKWNGELSGENNPKAKLNWSDVSWIRNANPSVLEFREKFPNINRTQFYNIKNFKSWIPA
jgi:hypothetical protein